MPPALPGFNLSLLPPTERVLIACSGGADSMALFLATHQTERDIVVSHINHGTRGEESNGDEAFVRDACTKLGVPYRAVRLSLKANANEADMRAARYEALMQLAHEYSCPRVATGHTADDVLETILLNLLRGASVAGFAGIPAERELAEEVLLVRPLLDVARNETREYLRALGWSWREDTSNLETRFTRNRVRSELLPVLTQISGKSVDQLAVQSSRAARIWRDDLELLNKLAQDTLSDLTTHDAENVLILDGLRFLAIPIALQRRVLRLATLRILPAAYDLELERVEEVRCHIAANGRRKVWQWRRDMRIEWTGEYSGNRIRFLRV